MLKGQLLHPHILSALAKSGHGSKVLISDGNYPHWTRRSPNAEVVYLNLSPGIVTVPDVLRVLVNAIPIEAVELMETLKSGPFATKDDPPVWKEYRKILDDAGVKVDFTKIERFKFYEATEQPEVCLTIATGEQRIYANILLTIGVVMAK